MSDERCGTYAGAMQHGRKREPFCEPCRAASAGYMTGYRQRVKLEEFGPRHGTERAVIEHWMNGEQLCVLCLAWEDAYRKALSPIGVVPARRSTPMGVMS